MTNFFKNKWQTKQSVHLLDLMDCVVLALLYPLPLVRKVTKWRKSVSDVTLSWPTRQYRNKVRLCRHSELYHWTNNFILLNGCIPSVEPIFIWFFKNQWAGLTGSTISIEIGTSVKLKGISSSWNALELRCPNRHLELTHSSCLTLRRHHAVQDTAEDTALPWE